MKNPHGIGFPARLVLLFWYWLTRIVPDTVQGAVKWLLLMIYGIFSLQLTYGILLLPL